MTADPGPANDAGRESEGSDLSGWQGGKDEARRHSGSYVNEPKTKPTPPG
jgi:hypothetical protein